MKSALLISTLLLFCFSTQGQTNNTPLFFENYLHETISLTQDELLFLKSGNFYPDSILLTEQEIRNIENKEPITGSLFDMLCAQAIINNWKSYKILSGDSSENGRLDNIEKAKKNLKMYYAGIVPINENYESYLILIDTYTEFRQKYLISMIRDAVLVNISDHKIQSVVDVSGYIYRGGESLYRYTEIQKNGTFISQLDATVNVIYENEEDRLKAEEETPLFLYNFRINAQGFVELIED